MYTPSKEWCEPFILQEQHIRKIIEIIENRRIENASSEYDPIYKYKRLDDYERKTNDINDLFKEDNCGRVRITSLKISCKDYLFAGSGLNYEIEFNSCEGSETFDMGFMFFKSISLGVKGEDRDISELLFNELDAYITNTIISHKHRWLVRILKRITPLGFMSVMMFFLIISSFTSLLLKKGPSNRQEIINNAVSSKDISQKLDTLLQLQQSEDVSNGVRPFIVIALLITLVVFFVLMSKKIRKKIYSYYPFVFDFGVSSEDYKTRTSKIKWLIGIIGTLALSVLANFLYNIISSGL
ncbi:hypothetical protein D5270_06660 [Acutalibacter sp. 1XD8-36]|nr:hypothetical protein [Acutalibacter sp. 1XD8-36]